MIHRRRAILTLLGTGLAGLSATARAAEDEEVDLRQVPGRILDTANKAVARASWSGAYRYAEQGNTFYELEGKGPRGREICVAVAQDGTLEEVETEIPVGDVPHAVMKAVGAKFQQFQASAAYEIRKDHGVQEYELDGRRPTDKDEVTIVVSADGRSVELDED